MRLLQRCRQIPFAIWVILLGMIVVSSLYELAQVHGFLPRQSGFSLVRPLIGVPFIVVAYVWLPPKHTPARLKDRRDKTLLVASVMALWFIVYFLSGLITTYVHNALMPDWRSIAQNILSYGLPVITIEYIRYRLMHAVPRRHIVWFGVVVSITMSLIWIDMAAIVNAQNGVQLIELLITEVATAFAVSAVATYVTVTVGVGAALTYRLGEVMLVTLLPILPKYDWYLASITTILLAMTVFWVVDQSSRRRRDGTQMGTHFHGMWAQRARNIALFVVFVATLFFVSGQFRYRPVVVMSNSMQPVFSRGSMIILEQIDPLDVRRGDIVQFSVDRITIMHRVVEIVRDNDQLEFVTKGDNNPDRDKDLVSAQQVRGVVRATVPLVGYPTVWLNESFREVGDR